MKQTINLQDSFLNRARKEKISLIIYLTNGVKLTGLVQGFDNYAIIFESLGKQQLIYKHAISTIVTEQRINLQENNQ
ncbi:MAG: RNA chaperone Hfq [Tissierellales bacterium]|nr:RNA chaperone Hfq [Tissierellales bacterium]